MPAVPRGTPTACSYGAANAMRRIVQHARVPYHIQYRQPCEVSHRSKRVVSAIPYISKRTYVRDGMHQNNYCARRIWIRYGEHGRSWTLEGTGGCDSFAWSSTNHVHMAPNHIYLLRRPAAEFSPHTVEIVLRPTKHSRHCFQSMRHSSIVLYPATCSLLTKCTSSFYLGWVSPFRAHNCRKESILLPFLATCIPYPAHFGGGMS